MNAEQGVGLRLELRLLGRFRGDWEGRELTLPKSRKARAILAYLAAERRPVSRDALCQLFFEDAADPRGGLRWCVSRLRRAVNTEDAELLLTAPEGLTLAPGLLATDTTQLEALAGNGATLAELMAFEQRLEGAFLEDLVLDSHPAFEAWRLAEGARCRELHGRLLRRIVAALEEQPEAVAFARRLCALEPVDEAAWALLVSSLLGAGERREARQVLRMAQEALAREGLAATGPLIATSRRLGPKQSSPRQAKPLGSRPVLAVLPCQGFGDVPAARVTETAHALFLAASTSKACLLGAQSLAQGESSAAAAAALQAGVDLLLESQLKETAEGLELSVQLTRAGTRALLASWRVGPESFDGDELRRAVVAQLSGRFELDLPIVLVGLSRDKPAAERSAWDLYYLALPKIYTADGYSADDALELLAEALAANPDIGPALCASAWVRSTHPQFNASATDRATSASMARRAVEICQDDAFVMGWAAICIAVLDRDIATAGDLARRARTFNAYSSMALIASGIVAHYAGADSEALQWIDQAERADTEPLTFLSYAVRAMASFQQDDLPGAIDWARKSVGRNPRFVLALRTLTAALAVSGDLAEAREWAQRLVEVDASEYLSFFPGRLPYADAGAVDKLCNALALAGVPETPPADANGIAS